MTARPPRKPAQGRNAPGRDTEPPEPAKGPGGHPSRPGVDAGIDGPRERLRRWADTGHPVEPGDVHRLAHLAGLDDLSPTDLALWRRWRVEHRTDPGASPTPDPNPKPPRSGPWLARRGLASRSGLPWLSGITPVGGTGAVGFLDRAEQLRGRPVDCMTLFQGGAHVSSWGAFVRCYQPGHHFQIGEETGAVIARGMVPILTVPALIHGATYADAVAGDYDDAHRQAADALANAGDPPLWIVRLSRESDDPHQPFGAERDITNFKRFHADRLRPIWHDALSARGRPVLFTFCLTKRGNRGLAAWDWGADIIDCDLYINSPPLTRDEHTRAYDRLFEPFDDHAARTDRPLAFSEWGVKVDETFGANDCQAGVQWMHSLFVRLAGEGRLVHENYYNPAGHGICPPIIDAHAASAGYAKLWKP